MSSISAGLLNGKPLDANADRELLIHLQRTGVSQARLDSAVLDTIAVQLRHRQITTEQAREWVRSEGLERYLKIDPKTGGAS
jgi:hypothetical protein